MFNTREDLNLRLSDSIIFLNDLPIYITGVDEQSILHYLFLSEMNARAQRISPTDPRLNYKPFPLGYYNTECDAHYVMRMPHRFYKQGLNIRSVTSKTFRIGREIFPTVVSEIVKNNYPTIPKIIDLFNSTNLESAAFHKAWAIQKNNLGLIFLQHKGLSVGWLNEENEVVLSENYQYLKENLLNIGVKLSDKSNTT